MATGEKKNGKKSKEKKAKKGFFRDERLKILLALLLLGFAFLLLISQISYLFTWKTDQSFQWAPAWRNPDIVVDNWAGKNRGLPGTAYHE